MASIRLFLLVLVAVGLVVCSSNDAPNDVAVPCGANAMGTSPSCSCVTPWQDCNGDLGKLGGNGCECNGTCTAGQCSTPATCNTATPHGCTSSASTCDPSSSTCKNCPPGMFDCDGLGSNGCESSDATCGVSAGTCSPTTAGSCSSETTYCDSTTLKCEPCPAAVPYNCDRNGTCDSTEVCGTTTGCLPECQEQTEIYCVKDPAKGNLCVPCLSDADCRANPRSRGPTCDTAQQLCTCANANDCSGDTSGAVCKQAGSVMSCGCNEEADCKVAPYTKCSPVVFGKCIKPCKTMQDCPDGQDCDVATGQCYDIGP